MLEPALISLPLFGPHDLALLADGPLHQEAGADVRGRAERERIGLFLLQPCQGVMRDATAGNGGRPDLDGANPTILSQPRRHFGLPPVILRERGHRVGRGLDDEVRRSAQLLRKVPHVVVRELLRCGHVLRIALRCAGVDPRNHRLELLVGQRTIVLEGLNADGAIDMPRGHLSRGDARSNRPHPRADLLVRHERHRRNVAGPVARLTLLLKDRRDVPGVGE